MNTFASSCRGAIARTQQSASAVKRAADVTSRRVVVSAGCGLNWLMGSRANGRIGILMYHRFANHSSGVMPPTWNVTPVAFRAQLAGLLERGFQAWPLRRLIDSHRQGTAAPLKTFAVTFDDGHESVYRYAWPILRELGVPATLFLPTAYVDSKQALPFDDWSAAGSVEAPPESWRPMTSEQCRAIAADGLVELGAHTHTHQDFRSRLDDFDRDLSENIDVLRSRFGVVDPPFAFPFGHATAAMMNIVRRSGLSCGLTMAARLVHLRDEPFGWGRFHVERWDTSSSLEAKLSGWYSWLPQIRRQLAGWRRTGAGSEAGPQS